MEWVGPECKPHDTASTNNDVGRRLEVGREGCAINILYPATSRGRELSNLSRPAGQSDKAAEHAVTPAKACCYSLIGLGKVYVCECE